MFIIIGVKVSKEGIVYVTFGVPAKRAAAQSKQTLRKVSDLPTHIVDETTFSGDPGYGARFAKLSMDLLAPVEFEKILYLDADTEIHGPIDIGFEILKAGFDMVIVPSLNQGPECMLHLTKEDRDYTEKILGISLPFIFQYQAGVMWFDRKTCGEFFSSWREEWQIFGKQDQGALLRALKKCPIRIWLLGRPYNGISGDLVIEHKFGSAVSRRFV